MEGKPLKSYLRMHRLRAGLFQEDVALLLGHVSSAHTCKHELGRRNPSLENLFAYEVVFGTAASNLYEGEFAAIRERIEGRVKGLIRYLEQRPQVPCRTQRLQYLRALAADLSAINPSQQ